MTALPRGGVRPGLPHSGMTLAHLCLSVHQGKFQQTLQERRRARPVLEVEGPLHLLLFEKAAQ
eukprot:8026186-Pyramimonas_sp.AAC.1